MKHFCMLLIGVLGFAIIADAADLSTATPEELLGVYKQLRAIPVGNEAAIAENVVFKRDVATFTFVSGRITFAAPDASLLRNSRAKAFFSSSRLPPSTSNRSHDSPGNPTLRTHFRKPFFSSPMIALPS